MSEELITRAELAKKLKLSVRMIINLQAKGLPVFYVSKKSPRYNYDLVLNWLSENHNNQLLRV